jgi:hypothetical protein
MSLPREALSVISEGFSRLLLATLQVPRVVGSHIRALKVAGEDLLKILQTIYHISQHVV